MRNDCKPSLVIFIEEEEEIAVNGSEFKSKHFKSLRIILLIPTFYLSFNFKPDYTFVVD